MGWLLYLLPLSLNTEPLNDLVAHPLVLRCSIKILYVYREIYETAMDLLITWILHQIFMFSNKEKHAVGQNNDPLLFSYWINELTNK